MFGANRVIAEGPKEGRELPMIRSIMPARHEVLPLPLSFLPELSVFSFIPPFCDHVPVTSISPLSLRPEPSPVTTNRSTLCLKATARERRGLCNSGCVRWRGGYRELWSVQCDRSNPAVDDATLKTRQTNGQEITHMHLISREIQHFQN